MNPVGVAAELAILRLHQQEFEVIWGSQVLRDTCLTNVNASVILALPTFW